MTLPLDTEYDNRASSGRRDTATDPRPVTRDGDTIIIPLDDMHRVVVTKVDNGVVVTHETTNGQIYRQCSDWGMALNGKYARPIAEAMLELAKDVNAR